MSAGRLRDAVPVVLPMLVLASALATAPAAAPVAAQDIVARANLGVPVPQGYYEQMARDPYAFTFSHERPENDVPWSLAAPGSLNSRPQPDLVHLGSTSMPILLALFSDSNSPPYTPEEIDRAVFAGPSETGTFKEFYEEISLGRLSVSGDVLPWQRVSLSMGQVVGSSNGLGGDARMGEYITQALDLYDETVDWGLYDNDGPDGIPNSGDDDGVVDVITIEFLEVAGSCGGPSIWPHRWNLNSAAGGAWQSNDPAANGGNIYVLDYITQSVTDCSGTQLQSAGTISHEYGHALGLPDYYHPDPSTPLPEFRRWVLGCWSLMAAGSWGCGPVGSNRTAYGPAHMVSWSKFRQGWLEYEEVGLDVRNQEFELNPIQLTGDALRIPMDEAGSNYLLVEYRRQVGFDWELPAEGVLVLRHEPAASLRPADFRRYRLRILEADGNEGLVRITADGGDRGLPGDVFGRPGTGGALNNLTNPSTRSGAGPGSRATIHSIRVENGKAYVRLSTAREPQIESPDVVPTRIAASPRENRFLITGGVMPYTATSTTLPNGLTLSADEDELVVGGGLLETGEVTFSVLVRDANGSGSVSTITLQVDPFVPAEALLVAGLLGGPLPPTEIEIQALDQGGNNNGIYDVGDFRAWLFRN